VRLSTRQPVLPVACGNASQQTSKRSQGNGCTKNFADLQANPVRRTTISTPRGNTGPLTYARHAAHAVGALLAVPDFSAVRAAKGFGL
jgi:hypothetical protein